MRLRFLIVDGYDAPGMADLDRVGLMRAGRLYQQQIMQIEPDADCDILELSQPNAHPISLEHYNGVVWTGSNMCIYSDTDPVRRHVEFCRMLFDRGIPQFGSCWAAQLAVTAAGGQCAANPLGREFGIARKIYLNDAGRAHPMMRHKPAVYDGFTSHSDMVLSGTEGTTVLAHNDFTHVQALEQRFENGVFWAVQYHPEYDFDTISRLAAIRKLPLMDQGFVRDESDLALITAAFDDLHRDPRRVDLRWRLGIGDDLIDSAMRSIELSNWIDAHVRSPAIAA